MKKIITGACIIIVYCFSACANEEQDTDSGLTNTDLSKPATMTPDSQNFVKPVITLPGNGQSVIAPLPQPVGNQTSSTTTAPGMNPPHGQPNHRCDIAVGAPLNSPATKPGTKTVSTTTTPAVQPTATPAQNTTAQTVTPAGMNPRHGEPGHRCDIPVGAPLNSPVAKPPTKTISATTTPAVQPTATSAQKATAKTVTPAGMNPRHGEPGHRCDISVGAPLNSPVAKPPTQPVTPAPVPAPIIVTPKKDSGS